MQNKLKENLRAFVVEKLQQNTGPHGIDLSAACADLITEKVFSQINKLVEKETTWDRQMKILAQLTPKKKPRPEPKAKTKTESETTAAIVSQFRENKKEIAPRARQPADHFLFAKNFITSWFTSFFSNTSQRSST